MSTRCASEFMAPKKAMAGMKLCIWSRNALGRRGCSGQQDFLHELPQRFHVSRVITDPAQIYLGFMHGLGHVLLDSIHVFRHAESRRLNCEWP